MNSVFQLSGFLVLPFWALMILLPRWRHTERILRSPFVILAPGILYGVLVLPRLADVLPIVTRPGMAAVAALLSTPSGATIGWVHFLAFDLFVGRWIYLDSRDRRISPWLMAPVLYLTLMLGPLGFVAYLLVRKLKAFAGTWQPQNRALAVLGVVMLGTFLAAAIGIAVDPRVITGAPAWLKPAKFAISVSSYSFTLVWLLSFIQDRPRLVRAIANVTALSLSVEMAVIILQAARGVTSHFNVTTPFDAFLWYTMGTFIGILWTMSLLAAIALIRQKMPDPAFAWSLRLAVVISLVGMAEAMLMAVFQGHSVGVPDGGPGLPILGWSTLGGDLRVAHFVGLHALQAMPLLGWLLARKTRLAAADRLRLVWGAGSAYLGLVALLTWQALRGQSVIHPDRTTLAAAAILMAAIAAIFYPRPASRPVLSPNDSSLMPMRSSMER